MTVSDEQMWDSRYLESDKMWSGNPNALLVQEATDLKPGRALDLGCGEGADAIWLARQGWNVVATDISSVALERAARHATQANVADSIEWQQHDLGQSFPEGTFDLVSAAFLHSPGDMPREEILKRAASAVAPGGTLLVIGHSVTPEGMKEHDHPHAELPSPQQVLDDLELPDEWEVLVCAEFEHHGKHPSGKPMPHLNNVVKARRRPAAE